MKYIICFFLLLQFRISMSQVNCLTVTSASTPSTDLPIHLQQCDAVLVGEFHGVLGAIEAKYELIKQLYSASQIKDLFMEIGQSAAFIYNRYLTTGDSTLLENPTMPYCIKKQEKLFWKRLYAFNKGLPDSLKITIHGVDFERLEFLKALKLMMPAEAITTSSMFVKTLMDEYAGLIASVAGYKTFDVVFSRYQKLWKAERVGLQELYGSYFGTADSIFSNVSNHNQFNTRNKTIFANIMAIKKQRQIKRILCFFGLNHMNSGKSYTLAGLLKNEGGFGKVGNISMLCKNCHDWQQYIKVANYAGPYTYQRDTTLIEPRLRNRNRYESRQCKKDGCSRKYFL